MAKGLSLEITTGKGRLQGKCCAMENDVRERL